MIQARHQRAFLLGAVGVGAVQAVGAVLTFASAVVLARVLGQEGFGAYVYATTWILLLTNPATFGMGPIVTRETAAAIELGRLERLGAIRAFAWRVTALSSLAVVGVGAVVLFADLPMFKGHSPALLWWALPLTGLAALLTVARHWLLGLRAVAAAQVAESLIRPGLVLAGVGGAALLGVPVSALTALLWFGAATLAGLLFTGMVAHRLAPRLTVGPADPGWLRACAPLLVTAVARDLNAEASVLVMGSFLGASDLGLFRAASRLASLPTFVLTAMNSSLQPVAAGLVATNNLDQLEQLGVRASRTAVLLSLPILALFAVAGGWVLTLFGPGFAAAAPALAILSLGHLFNVACGSVGVILVAGRREADAARGLAVSCFVSLTANFVLVPWLGLVGAATASALALVVWNVWLTAATWRHLGIVPAVFRVRRNSP